MDFIEKARIRLENWITHNDNHQEEYEMFAEQLEEAGKNESSEHVRAGSIPVIVFNEIISICLGCGRTCAQMENSPDIVSEISSFKFFNEVRFVEIIGKAKGIKISPLLGFC